MLSRDKAINEKFIHIEKGGDSPPFFVAILVELEYFIRVQLCSNTEG